MFDQPDRSGGVRGRHVVEKRLGAGRMFFAESAANLAADGRRCCYEPDVKVVLAVPGLREVADQLLKAVSFVVVAIQTSRDATRVWISDVEEQSVNRTRFAPVVLGVDSLDSERPRDLLRNLLSREPHVVVALVGVERRPLDQPLFDIAPGVGEFDQLPLDLVDRRLPAHLRRRAYG